MVSLCNLRSVIHAEHIASTEAAWEITVSESMYAMGSDGRQNEWNYQQNIGAVFVCLLNAHIRENQQNIRALRATFTDCTATYIFHSTSRMCDNTRGLRVVPHEESK